MYIITQESKIQENVFIVNILSPRKRYVMRGNIRYDIPNAKNLTPHALSPRAPYAYCAAKYAHSVVGIANKSDTINEYDFTLGDTN